MRIQELLDTIYDTITLEVNASGGATAKFRTDIDEYTVMISSPNKQNISFGGTYIPVPISSISFSSRLLSMGHANAEHAKYTTYVYPTVVKCIEMYVNKQKQLKKPVYGFTCSVAGDNARGSKRKIYQALFTFSTRFGFHRWKKQLLAIRLDLYERLKKNGFQTEDGRIVFDSEL